MNRPDPNQPQREFEAALKEGDHVERIEKALKVVARYGKPWGKAAAELPRSRKKWAEVCFGSLRVFLQDGSRRSKIDFCFVYWPVVFSNELIASYLPEAVRNSTSQPSLSFHTLAAARLRLRCIL